MELKLRECYLRKMKNNVIGIATVLYMFLFHLSGCKHDSLIPKGEDLRLYELALNTAGFSWFENKDDRLPQTQGSGHSESHLRTRYNDIASQVLDSEGRIQADTTFPEGSLVVKELYEGSRLATYAILLKDGQSAAADQNGWIWGYLYSNGEVREPAANKGSGCRSCHSQPGNIDYMLMNKAFPN